MASKPCKFIHKLIDMLDDSCNTEIIKWNRNGDAIIISNEENLKTLLTKYYNIHSIKSFQRQLRMYGFKVIHKDLTKQYSHPLFKKQNQHEFYKITRNNNCPQKDQDYTDLFDENQNLIKQLRQIQQEQSILQKQIKYQQYLHQILQLRLGHKLRILQLCQQLRETQKFIEKRQFVLKVIAGFNEPTIQGLVNLFFHEQSIVQTPIFSPSPRMDNY